MSTSEGLKSEEQSKRLRELRSDVEKLLNLTLDEEVKLYDVQAERRALTRRIVQAAKALQFYFERKAEAGGDDAEYVPLAADALNDVEAMERELQLETALLEKYDALLKQWKRDISA